MPSAAHLFAFRGDAVVASPKPARPPCAVAHLPGRRPGACVGTYEAAAVRPGSPYATPRRRVAVVVETGSACIGADRATARRCALPACMRTPAWHGTGWTAATAVCRLRLRGCSPPAHIPVRQRIFDRRGRTVAGDAAADGHMRAERSPIADRGLSAATKACIVHPRMHAGAASPASQPAPATVDDERLRRILDAADRLERGERQGHGFVFQDDMSPLLDLYAPGPYAYPVDAFERDPRSGGHPRSAIRSKIRLLAGPSHSAASSGLQPSAPTSVWWSPYGRNTAPALPKSTHSGFPPTCGPACSRSTPRPSSQRRCSTGSATAGKTMHGGKIDA